MKIAVIGAGAFGTALAISLAREGRKVSLWARDSGHVRDMQVARENQARLVGHPFPDGLTVLSDLGRAVQSINLLALPTQSIAPFLVENATLFQGKSIVAACKGIDLASGRGPSAVIRDAVPDVVAGVLSGPSFAADIVAGLPTALTLATADDADGQRLQAALSTETLRIYRGTDVIGVETGGALKNVMALACGMTMGAGLGESARAALMTRGYAEMVRFAETLGASADTLAGLSGFGDLILTCTSIKSRNFSHGLKIGSGDGFQTNATVEGVATAQAVAQLASARGLDMPITRAVAAILNQDITVGEAMLTLPRRPLKKE